MARSESDSEPAVAQPRTKTSSSGPNKNQTRATGGDSKKRKLNEGSPEVPEQVSPSQDRSKKAKLPTKSSVVAQDSDEGDSDAEIKKQRQLESLKRIKEKAQKKPRVVTSSESDDDDAPKKHQKSRKESKKSLSPDSEPISDDVPVALPTSKQAARSAKSSTKNPSKASSDEGVEPEPVKRKGATGSKNKTTSDEVSEPRNRKIAQKPAADSDGAEKNKPVPSGTDIDDQKDKKSSGSGDESKLKKRGDKKSGDGAEVTKTAGSQNKKTSAKDEPLEGKKKAVQSKRKQSSDRSESDLDDLEEKPYAKAASRSPTKSSGAVVHGTSDAKDKATTKKQPSVLREDTESSDEKGASSLKKTGSDSEEEPAQEESDSKKKVKSKTKDAKTGDKKDKSAASQDDKNSTSEKKNQKDSKEGDDELKRYKHYLKEAGIHVFGYAKLFAGITSVKKQKKKILELLKEKGLEGRPTIEACRKLKMKRETDAEIASLDTKNILSTTGRSTRGTVAAQPRKQAPKKPAGRVIRVSDSSSPDSNHDDAGNQEQKSDEESDRDAFANLRDCIESEKSE